MTASLFCRAPAASDQHAERYGAEVFVEELSSEESKLVRGAAFAILFQG